MVGWWVDLFYEHKWSFFPDFFSLDRDSLSIWQDVCSIWGYNFLWGSHVFGFSWFKLVCSTLEIQTFSPSGVRIMSKITRFCHLLSHVLVIISVIHHPWSGADSIFLPCPFLYIWNRPFGVRSNASVLS